MSSSPPPPSPSPPPRPQRPPRPSFYLNNDDDDDGFFVRRTTTTPIPVDDIDPAAVPLPTSTAASESDHSEHPPLLSPHPRTTFSGSPSTSPFLFRYRPAGPPPSAFRPDSPDDGILPAPPLPRPNNPLSQASRTSSAHSFAPPPLPWLRDLPSTSRPSSAFTSATDGHLTPRRKPATSHLLTGPVPKPWLAAPDPWARAAQWITRALFLLGLAAAAAICFVNIHNIDTLPNVCLLMEDNFETLNTNTWQREVEVGALTNGEFQWYTASDNNSFVDSGHLYIVPTPTSLAIGEKAVFNGYKLALPDCTSRNKSACAAASSDAAGTVINPVQSARLTTRLSYNLKYGRVEVRAKMPQGDWLWPAIWMLPVNETYGPWPMSGEIDIAEARGNALSYPAQGSNFISSTLNWGPTTTINAWTKTWGWSTQRRTSYASGFHTYALEWTEDFMRFYIDTRVHATLALSFRKKSLFSLGDFPQIIHSGAQDVVLPNPWAARGNNAPFDQPFYLVLNVAAGGTNGWFPDGVGGKPWVDQSASAMRDFAFHQPEWYATWPADVRERAMVVDSVKMWTRC